MGLGGGAYCLGLGMPPCPATGSLGGLQRSEVVIVIGVPSPLRNMERANGTVINHDGKEYKTHTHIYRCVYVCIDRCVRVYVCVCMGV